MVNADGLTSDFSFSMADTYCCYAKAFGSKAVLVAPRVLTAPNDLDVQFSVLDNTGEEIRKIDIGKDDSFLKSIDNFYNCIADDTIRTQNADLIIRQAKFIEQVKKIGGID